MEILKTKNLTRTFGQQGSFVRAVDGINLTIERGEFIAIVGASGSGKSTLMHLLGGVDTPTSGKIFIENSDISTYSNKELAFFRRRKVGLIYQFYNLIPNLSVKHNIVLPLKLDNKKVDTAYFDELVEKLGIKDKLNDFPTYLSGGQKQRVAIARSLIYRPAIILADEPTGNLDKQNSNEIVDLLNYSHRTYKQTVVVITHDESIALKAKRIIRMEDGHIVEDSHHA